MPGRKKGNQGSSEWAKRQSNERKAANQRNYAARLSQASQDGAAGAGAGASAPTDENAGPVAQRRFRPAFAVAAVAGLFLVGLCGFVARAGVLSDIRALTPSSALYSRRRRHWCRHAPCSGYSRLYVCGHCPGLCPGFCPGGECGNWNQGCYFFGSPSLDQPPAFSLDGG
jgi:hypothetical protein